MHATPAMTEAVTHMEINGGAINWNRSEVLAADYIETCAVCHGSGNAHGMDEVHTALDD